MSARLLGGVLLLCSLHAVGCGYECVKQCEAAAEQIAANGFNPATGENGGMDPDTVCDQDEIRAASTCEECREAFAILFRLESERQVCDCPREGDQISVVLEECDFELRDATEEQCAEVQSPEYDEHVRTCLSL